MNLNINNSEDLEKNKLIKEFIKKLNDALEKLKNNIESEILTPEEDMIFYREKTSFLKEFFKEKLSNKNEGEIFIVTDKYENDSENQRYKVAQYIDNQEWKFVAFKKDLPENVKIGDIVRKNDGKYFFDEKSTEFVNNNLDRIKKEIINNRINK